MRRVSIHNTTKGRRVPRKALIKLAYLVLSGEKRTEDVNLIFISDIRMKALNREFRKNSKSTDVLSFSLGNDCKLLGEIYISVPTALRNARADRIPGNREFLKLFCHGLLHLCGIHHPNAAARTVMAAKEDRYLAKSLELARS